MHENLANHLHLNALQLGNSPKFHRLILGNVQDWSQLFAKFLVFGHQFIFQFLFRFLPELLVTGTCKTAGTQQLQKHVIHIETDDEMISDRIWHIFHARMHGNWLPIEAIHEAFRGRRGKHTAEKGLRTFNGPVNGSRANEYQKAQKLS